MYEYFFSISCGEDTAVEAIVDGAFAGDEFLVVELPLAGPQWQKPIL